MGIETPSPSLPSERILMLVETVTFKVDVPVKGHVTIEVNVLVETSIVTPIRGHDGAVVVSVRGSLAIILHDCRSQKALFDIIHAHTIHTRTFHSLKSLLNCLESRFVASSSRLQILHALFNVIKTLFDAH